MEERLTITKPEIKKKQLRKSQSMLKNRLMKLLVRRPGLPKMQQRGTKSLRIRSLSNLTQV